MEAQTAGGEAGGERQEDSMRFHPDDIGDRQGDERRDRAAEAHSLYFSDYCIEAGVLACHFCGSFEPDIELVVIVQDAGEPVRVCLNCAEESAHGL